MTAPYFYDIVFIELISILGGLMSKFVSFIIAISPLLVYAIISTILGFMWQYNLECWTGLEYIEWWKCFVIALIPGVGHLGFPAWIVTFIVWGL